MTHTQVKFDVGVYIKLEVRLWFMNSNGCKKIWRLLCVRRLRTQPSWIWRTIATICLVWYSPLFFSFLLLALCIFRSIVKMVWISARMLMLERRTCADRVALRATDGRGHPRADRLGGRGGDAHGARARQPAAHHWRVAHAPAVVLRPAARRPLRLPEPLAHRHPPPQGTPRAISGSMRSTAALSPHAICVCTVRSVPLPCRPLSANYRIYYTSSPFISGEAQFSHSESCSKSTNHSIILCICLTSSAICCLCAFIEWLCELFVKSLFLL